MSWVVETVLQVHNWWNNVDATRRPIAAEKTSSLQPSSNTTTFKPLRIGVLSAAAINFTAIIDPVSTQRSTLITGIAARDLSRAQAQIQTYKSYLPGDCKAYGSYDALLSDPDIDAVYIPLPNGLHHKWALAALEKGKHVLVEKPLASNAQQARDIRAAASRAGGKVALEAFHWRFHPAAHAVKAMLLSGQYGAVRSVDARMSIPAGVLKKDDIRLQYGLAGGSCMDFTYVFSAIAYFAVRDVADPNVEFSVRSATARVCPRDKLVDEAMQATVTFKESGQGGDVQATISTDLAQPWLFGVIPKLWTMSPGDVTIQTDEAEIAFSNFVGPWTSHSIAVTPLTRDPGTGQITKRGKTTTQKHWTGGPQWSREEGGGGGGNGIVGHKWWTTYRYQLEGFARKIQNKQDYKGPWVSLDESVRVMEIIDAVYEKAGLPVRGR